MKRTRYILFLLAMLAGIVARGQGFNPDSPAEPSSRYKLSVAVSPAEAATVKGEGWYAVNTRVTVTATATSSKWKFAGWTNSKGEQVNSNISFTYTTSNSPETLTAHFEEAKTGMLTIQYDPASIATGSTKEYQEGTQVSVSCSNYNYYTFVNWTDSQGTEVSTARSFTYIATGEDETLTAHYQFTPSSPSEPTETKARHKVYFTVNPSGAGSVNQSNGWLLAEGATFSVTASAGTGYVFSHWTRDQQTVGEDRTYSSRMGEEDITLTANFRFEPGGPSEPSTSTRQRHSLYGTTIETYKGETKLYPIYLENTGDVRDLSFKLVLPEGIVADAQGVQTTLRTSAYTASGSQEDDKLTVSLSGGSQISEHNGAVVRIPLISAASIPDGEYAITLTDIVATRTDGTPVSVSSRPGVLVVSTLEEGDIQAQFNVDRYMNRAQFTNMSTEGARSFLWEFGDGQSSTEANPMHIYASAGTYTVRLTARGIVRTDVAEQTIVINPASTWTASGDYTLDEHLTGARNFTSLHEAISLLSQCTPEGAIRIDVTSGGRYDIRLAEEDSLLLVVQLAAKLQIAQAGMHLQGPSESGARINFIVNDVSEDMQSVMALIARFTADGVEVCINGVPINITEIGKYEGQTVCSGHETLLETISAIGDGDRLKVSWTASVASGCKLTGYEVTGTGDLPAMNIVNGGTTTDVVSYHVNVTLDDVIIYQYIYKVYVKPLLASQTLALSSPADQSELDFGNVTLRWTNLGSMATGYTLYLDRTIDGDVSSSEVKLTTYSYTLSAVPGATYSWRVTAHGDCDNLSSETRIFTVRQQADLIATDVEAPAETKANTNLTVIATIRNIGKGTTQRSSWNDAIYSGNKAGDFANAKYIGYVAHNGALAPGQEYKVTFTVKAPDASEGEVYYYVKADYSESEIESNEVNNSAESQAVTLINKFVAESDYNALKKLYQATNGEVWTKTWKVNSSAITSTAWPGVSFDDEGHVTAISLPGNNMSGELPTEGFVLPQLRSLDLDHNNLRGNLAAFCQGLTAIETLDMSYCSLTGLSDVLPATITNLNLGYQRNDVSLAILPMQQWLMGDPKADVQLGSLIAYDHARQNFEAHPRLQLRTATDNVYVGYMEWQDGSYQYHLNGDYKQYVATEFVVQPTQGPASYTRLRAQLMWLKGDANVDAQVDVLDAQHTLNYILGTQRGNFNFMAADTRASESINVQDVVVTINLFIADEDEAGVPEAVHVRQKPVAGEMPAGHVVCQHGELYLNTQVPVAALDITLEGVKANQLKLVLNRNQFQMITHDTSRGVRIVIISPTGDVIGDATPLLRFNGDALVTSVRAADADASLLWIAIDGDADAIRQVGSEAVGGTYDLSGRRLQNVTAKGLYIRNGKKIISK